MKMESIELPPETARAAANGLLPGWEKAAESFDWDASIFFERALMVVGREEDLPGRGYRGKTLKTCRKVIQNTETALRLHRLINARLEQAQSILEPTSVFARMAGALFSSNANRALQVLGTKIHFTEEEESFLASPSSLLISREMFTLEEAVEAGNAAYEAANTMMDHLSLAWQMVETSTADLEARAHDLVVALTKLPNTNKMASLNSRWIPQMQTSVTEVVRNAASDPMEVMETLAHQAKGYVAIASLGVCILDLGHRNENATPPALVDLKKAGQDVDWWNARIRDAYSDGEALASEATLSIVEKEMSSICRSLESLDKDAGILLDLEVRRAPSLNEQIAGLKGDTERLREALSESLDVQAELILTEPDPDPVDLLEATTHLFRQARQAVASGRSAAACKHLDSVEDEVKKVEKILLQAKNIAKGFPERQTRLMRYSKEQKGAIPEHEELLENFQKKYAPSALIARNSDGTEVTGEYLDNYLNQAFGLLGDANSRLERGARKYAGGKLFVGWKHQDKAEAYIVDAKALLEELSLHSEKADHLAEENASSLRALEARLSELVDREKSFCLEVAFKERLDVAEEHCADLRKYLVLERRDPFAISEKMVRIHSELEVVERECVRLLWVFEQCRRRLEDVQERYAEVENAAQRARVDGIPDSEATKKALENVEALREQIVKQVDRLGQEGEAWDIFLDHIEELDREMDKTYVSLLGELELAVAARKAYQRAKEAYERASKWHRRAGRNHQEIVDLSIARALITLTDEMLNAGNYKGTILAADRTEHSIRLAMKPVLPYIGKNW